MNKSTYELVEQFVIDAFTRAEKKGNIRHLKRAVYWVEQLHPQADEALRIAAIGHDIERAFRKIDTEALVKTSPEGYLDKKFLALHQEESARVIGDFLEKQGVGSAVVKRVLHPVAKHEVGGDEDQNILKDADSLSFLENIGARFDAHWAHRAALYGKDKVRMKFQWMYDRITSEKARAIARPWYEEAIKKLDT